MDVQVVKSRQYVQVDSMDSGTLNSHRLRHVPSKGSIKMTAYEMYKLDKTKIIRSLSPSPVTISRQKPEYLKDS